MQRERFYRPHLPPTIEEKIVSRASKLYHERLPAIYSLPRGKEKTEKWRAMMKGCVGQAVRESGLDPMDCKEGSRLYKVALKDLSIRGGRRRKINAGSVTGKAPKSEPIQEKESTKSHKPIFEGKQEVFAFCSNFVPYY